MRQSGPSQERPLEALSEVLDSIGRKNFTMTCPSDPAREADQGMLELQVRNIEGDLQPLLPVRRISDSKFPLSVRLKDGSHLATIFKDKGASPPYTVRLESDGLEHIWGFEGFMGRADEIFDKRAAAGLPLLPGISDRPEFDRTIEEVERKLFGDMDKR